MDRIRGTGHDTCTGSSFVRSSSGDGCRPLLTRVEEWINNNKRVLGTPSSSKGYVTKLSMVSSLIQRQSVAWYWIECLSEQRYREWVVGSISYELLYYYHSFMAQLGRPHAAFMSVELYRAELWMRIEGLSLIPWVSPFCLNSHGISSVPPLPGAQAGLVPASLNS